jgi:hypothetical protein
MMGVTDDNIESRLVFREKAVFVFVFFFFTKSHARDLRGRQRRSRQSSLYRVRFQGLHPL